MHGHFLGSGPGEKVLKGAGLDGRSQYEVLKAFIDQKERVTALLDESRDVVGALRDALLERDELVNEEITTVIEKAVANRN